MLIHSKDPAFCLNHLVLKAVHLPGSRARLLDEAAHVRPTFLKRVQAAVSDFNRATRAADVGLDLPFAIWRKKARNGNISLGDVVEVVEVVTYFIILNFAWAPLRCDCGHLVGFAPVAGTPPPAAVAFCAASHSAEMSKPIAFVRGKS